jgi:hypothetical protein
MTVDALGILRIDSGLYAPFNIVGEFDVEQVFLIGEFSGDVLVFHDILMKCAAEGAYADVEHEQESVLHGHVSDISIRECVCNVFAA